MFGLPSVIYPRDAVHPGETFKMWRRAGDRRISAMTKQGARAKGIANIAMDGTILDTWYPSPALIDGADLVPGTVRLGAADIPDSYLKLIMRDDDRLVEQVAVETTIADLQSQAVDAHDVYLRLHLLSHRLVKPLTINMDNALRTLSTVVWTNKGPALPDNFEFQRTELRSRGLIHVYGIEKLPRMVDYVVPSGINIAEAERVRLGAYLAPGTRVLREGYVSFNSGTLGAARVEGRLSSSTLVGESCEVGLSSTFMAKRRHDTLREPITMGNNCRLGVSSGVLGISLGDDCTVAPNIVIAPDTQLYDTSLDQHVRGSTLDGLSAWTVRMSPDHSVPVVHWNNRR